MENNFPLHEKISDRTGPTGHLHINLAKYMEREDFCKGIDSRMKFEELCKGDMTVS
jgi:hypothetical protein